MIKCRLNLISLGSKMENIATAITVIEKLWRSPVGRCMRWE